MNLAISATTSRNSRSLAAICLSRKKASLRSPDGRPPAGGWFPSMASPKARRVSGGRALRSRAVIKVSSAAFSSWGARATARESWRKTGRTCSAARSRARAVRSRLTRVKSMTAATPSTGRWSSRKGKACVHACTQTVKAAIVTNPRARRASTRRSLNRHRSSVVGPGARRRAAPRPFRPRLVANKGILNFPRRCALGRVVFIRLDNFTYQAVPHNIAPREPHLGNSFDSLEPLNRIEQAAGHGGGQV